MLSWFKLRKKLKLEILFFAWQPENNASSRYRAYKVAEHLRKQGFECIVRPPVSIGFYERYYEKGGRINQLIFFSVVFLNRIKDIIMSVRYDVVIMQRDLFMLFYYIPSILERFLKRLNPNIIFDFDDFIFVPPPQSVQGKNRFAIWMAKRKTYANIRLSKHIIVSNEYLHKYILKYDKAVTIIPTCIDIERYTIKTKRHSPKIIIGWIGNPGNLFYLNSLERVFKKLADKYDFILKVVCSKDFKLDGIKVVNSNWRIETEIEDIQSFDIGIMPLTNNEYTKGKGGFKALQYMAVGIPAVCSPVGILTAIIEDGINGFLAHSDEEWIKKLSFLIEDEKLRNKLGANGRHTVEEYFSFNVNIPKFKTVIEEISSGTGKAAL